jgi:DNA-binding MarR family transcriptional regulator
MAAKLLPSLDLRQIAWADLLRAHAHLLRMLDEKLVGQDLLPLDWYDVLLTLARAPGQRLRLSELADRVFLSRSGLTRLVDRLEKANLLKREPCPDDRRGHFAVLLPAAEVAMQKTWPTYEHLINQHFGRHLSDAEAATLHDVFARIAPPPAEVSEPVQVGVKRKA